MRRRQRIAARGAVASARVSAEATTGARARRPGPARAAWRATPRSSRSRPGLSRIAGLVREIVASSYFATSGAFSAFTIAFQVPNVVRSLFADAALSAAFVPVFTELLEHGKRREAFRLASTLLLADPHRARRDHGAVRRRRGARHAAVHRRRLRGASSRTSPSGSRRSCSRSSCCSGSTACSSGSSTPTTTSRSRRSARWSGTW